jgi:hypothetical protein
MIQGDLSKPMMPTGTPLGKERDGCGGFEEDLCMTGMTRFAPGLASLSRFDASLALGCGRIR